MVLEISAKGLPLLRRSTPIKTAQDKEDEIKQKLYEDNKWGNDWKFQLY